MTEAVRDAPTLPTIPTTAWEPYAEAQALLHAWGRLFAWYVPLPAAQRPWLGTPALGAAAAALEQAWERREAATFRKRLRRWEGLHYAAPPGGPPGIPLRPAWDPAEAARLRAAMGETIVALARAHERRLRPDYVRGWIWQQMIWAEAAGDLPAHGRLARAYTRVWAALVHDPAWAAVHQPLIATKGTTHGTARDH